MVTPCGSSFQHRLRAKQLFLLGPRTHLVWNSSGPQVLTLPGESPGPQGFQTGGGDPGWRDDGGGSAEPGYSHDTSVPSFLALFSLGLLPLGGQGGSLKRSPTAASFITLCHVKQP